MSPSQGPLLPVHISLMWLKVSDTRNTKKNRNNNWKRKARPAGESNHIQWVCVYTPSTIYVQWPCNTITIMNTDWEMTTFLYTVFDYNNELRSHSQPSQSVAHEAWVCQLTIKYHDIEHQSPSLIFSHIFQIIHTVPAPIKEQIFLL